MKQVKKLSTRKFGSAITAVLASRVDGNIERTAHLVSLIDTSQLASRPSVPEGSEPVIALGHLLGHLLDCMAGFCAALYAAFPSALDHLQDLKKESVNHFCGPDEALPRMRVYRREIARGFRMCSDKHLKRKLKTVFEPEGEPLAAILLSNLEHLLNHKYQLFLYLRLSGARVSTKDLYRLPEKARAVRRRRT